MNPRIEINPQIQHGRPVIKGTRIPVLSILGCLAEGMTLQEAAAEYNVAPEDAAAALEFAAELVEQAQQRPVHAER
jgi:uncharacterized protein (DUF433 family)